METKNKYDPIKEENEEDLLDEQDEIEEYMEWLEMQDQPTILAHQAMDELRDAEDELEELRAAAVDEQYWELREQRSDAEVEKSLMGAEAHEVVKFLKGSAHDDEVVKCLSSCCGEQLDYDHMLQLERRDKTFAAMLEQLQERRMQDDMLRAHAASGSNPAHLTQSDPKNTNPGAITGQSAAHQELDF